MHNKHQELIAEKVAEFEKKKRELKDWQYGTVYKGYDQEEEAETLAENVDEFLTPDWFTQTLQDTINTVLEEERKQMLSTILKIVDGHKVVYQKGDERFDSEAEDGDEKDHIDSSENETLDEVLESLNKLTALDKTPPNKV